jgi:hypothetical protein
MAVALKSLNSLELSRHSFIYIPCKHTPCEEVPHNYPRPLEIGGDIPQWL